MSNMQRVRDAPAADMAQNSADGGNRSIGVALSRTPLGTWSWLLALVVVSATAGCQQATDARNALPVVGSSETVETPEPAPAVAQISVVARDKAAMCGRSLGIGVRCNMLKDEGDFAIVRYLVLDGLRNQSAPSADFSEIETAFDLGTLEMINTVGTCQATPAELAALERQIEAQLATCKAQ